MRPDYSTYDLTDLYQALENNSREDNPENRAEILRQIEIRKTGQGPMGAFARFRQETADAIEYRPENSVETAPPDEIPQAGPRIASAWERLGALIVDILVLLPVFVLVAMMSYQSLLSSLFGQLLNGALFICYHVYFHYRFGATPGKMLLKIKVVNEDYSKINLGTAIKRSGVDIAFRILSTFILIRTFLSIGNAPPAGDGMGYKLLTDSVDYKAIEWMQFIWGCSEIVTCLFNERRKAIHDFIAGTVVIKRPAG